MMMSEKCSCGATIEVDANAEQTVLTAIKDWRRKHKHNYPINPYRWQQSPFTVTSNGTITASQLTDTELKTEEN